MLAAELWVFKGYIGVILGLCRVYIGVIEKKMELLFMVLGLEFDDMSVSLKRTEL